MSSWHRAYNFDSFHSFCLGVPKILYRPADDHTLLSICISNEYNLHTIQTLRLIDGLCLRMGVFLLGIYPVMTHSPLHSSLYQWTILSPWNGLVPFLTVRLRVKRGTCFCLPAKYKTWPVGRLSNTTLLCHWP